jgi:hypothetical protein
MQSTGKMVYQPVIGEWTIEYWCPNDQEFFRIYTPENKALADEVAASEG